jgi:hypothetical protein
MGLLPTTIYPKEAFFAYVILSQGLVAKLRAIRPTHRVDAADVTMNVKGRLLMTERFEGLGRNLGAHRKRSP